ncbi:MAG TPA: enolase C-terminal domain-like protein [Candidatus Limnocylindria bacterium]|nr:enolase C-terminal domain-like protein [Candidatus Limnocylindria bacterium]
MFFQTGKPTDVRIVSTELYFLPVQTRVPLKFGRETLSSVTCARVRLTIVDRQGRSAEGWGETPLSVQWVWPSSVAYNERHEALRLFSRMLAQAWAHFIDWGHPIELGSDFSHLMLPRLLEDFNDSALATLQESMPLLAALVCSSPFDLALHDAYGNLHERPTYSTYTPEFMNRDLGDYFGSALPEGARTGSALGFLRPKPELRLPVWHLVGGLDPLTSADLTGQEPNDGYPVLLSDWIRRDGLRCLKVKLRGTDWEWDYQRIRAVAAIALPLGVKDFTADFNCTVQDPEYVLSFLARLAADDGQVYESLLYVEQPFEYELERRRLDVSRIARLKPLFLDESAHDWRCVATGHSLGWNGVALKTCKTQSGALLSAAWALAHGMQLMVQDLTNPMLAQVTHCLLAAHVPTLMGVESNANQFYPEASLPEAAVFPGLYTRREGVVDLSDLRGNGFGMVAAYRIRKLPDPAISCGT